MEQFTLNLNERAEVVMLIDGKSINLGPKDHACEEMARFLEEVDYGG